MSDARGIPTTRNYQILRERGMCVWFELSANPLRRLICVDKWWGEETRQIEVEERGCE